MLPIGLSDMPGEAMVKLYCPKCCDVYTPKSSKHHHTDGAYFGTGAKLFVYFYKEISYNKSIPSRFSTHAFHGASRIQTKTTSKSIRC